MSFSNLTRSLFSGFAVAAALGLAGCGKPAEHARPADPAKVRVQTMAVAESEWPDGFEAPGTVRARTTTQLSSRVMGYVRDVRVREGDRVQSGQTVITIEAKELETAERQAKAALAEARSGLAEVESAIASARAQKELAELTLRRMSDLFEKRSISRQELDEASARARVAQAAEQMAASKRQQLEDRIRQATEAVASAGTMVGYTEIKAPFAGRVIARRVEPGSLAAPGAPLVELEQEGAFRLEAAVEESRLGVIRTGQAVEVRLEAISEPLRGTVVEIVPAVDEASRTFTAKISLPGHSALRSGLYGRAVFSTGTRRALAVPRAAVAREGQLESVLVADDGVARARLVRLGRARGAEVEVLAGLAAGDRLIWPRPAGLADGAPVEVQP